MENFILAIIFTFVSYQERTSPFWSVNPQHIVDTAAFKIYILKNKSYTYQTFDK